MTALTEYFPLTGGVDHVTPRLVKDPGRLVAVENFEPGPGGYCRIDGYERFDGQISPSAATYCYITFNAGQFELSAGDWVRGETSGATGTVMEVTVSSGAWGTSDAAGVLAVLVTSGTFADNEDIETITAAGAFSGGFSPGFP